MYQEAINDNVRMVDNWDRGGFLVYYPKCHLCGKEIACDSYSSKKTYTCKSCKLKLDFLKSENGKLQNEQEKEKKYKYAVSRIEKARKVYKDDYSYTFKRVYEHLFRKGWFQSTEEIIVACELLFNKVKVRHQVKIGNYRADFVLPEEKIVLEVDGKVFHDKTKRDSEWVRDTFILLSLGEGWEVIRISDKFVNENIGLIFSSVKHRKKELERVRGRNKGSLPKWHLYKRYIDDIRYKDPYLEP